MNPNIWICIERGNKKFLRPTNHANCESLWHSHYEHEAEKVMFEVGQGFEIGKLYDKEEAKLKMEKNLSLTDKWLADKVAAYNDNPKETLENMLSTTNDVIEQFINSPGVAQKELLKSCMQHNKLFLQLVEGLDKISVSFK